MSKEKKKSWEFTEGPGYTWRQTLKEVEIVIPLEKGKRARDLNVVIKGKNLKVSYKSNDSNPIVQGELFNKIIPDETTWSIEDNNLVILMDKFNQIEWWECVILGHPKIDVTSIEPENSTLGDLDLETRGLVEKMVVENRERVLAEENPTKEAKLAAFERFKKEHPEMDFSKVDMNKV